MAAGGDKPKKTWREIDAGKDRSAHRREERPAKGGPRAAERSLAAQKQYRATLDKLFDGSAGVLHPTRRGVPDGWKKVLPEMPADPATSGRQEALRAIRGATDRAGVEASVAKLLSSLPLPDDPDVLVQVLLHSSDSIIEDALQRLDTLLPLQAPAARQVLTARLRRIEDDEDCPKDLREKAANVRKKT